MKLVRRAPQMKRYLTIIFGFKAKDCERMTPKEISVCREDESSFPSFHERNFEVANGKGPW